MRKRTKVLIGAGAAAVAFVAVAGGLFWYLFLRDDAPPEVSLAGALNSLATSTPAANTAAANASASPAASASVGTSSTSTTSSSPGINGTWAPDSSQASFVGYRVNEQLVRIGVNTAVGRTSAVTGQVVIDGGTVTSATFEADLTKLKSDSNMRDGQLRNQAIETNRFPKATFALTQPIALPAEAEGGQQFDATLNGKLTLHGVTRDVAIPAHAQLKDGHLVVVGSLDIAFADYNISKPNGASVLSIEDHGVMELQLVLSAQ